MTDYKIPKIAVDTSVIIKWFKKEEGSEHATKLRGDAEEGKIKLIISCIALSEVARGLKKAGWETEDILKCLNLLDTIIKLSEIDIIEVDMLVIKLAQELVVRFNLYSADAIHLSTAILSNSDVFISADRHHTKDNIKEYSHRKGVKVMGLLKIKDKL